MNQFLQNNSNEAEDGFESLKIRVGYGCRGIILAINLLLHNSWVTSCCNAVTVVLSKLLAKKTSEGSLAMALSSVVMVPLMPTA